MQTCTTKMLNNVSSILWCVLSSTYYTHILTNHIYFLHRLLFCTIIQSTTTGDLQAPNLGSLNHSSFASLQGTSHSPQWIWTAVRSFPCRTRRSRPSGTPAPAHPSPCTQSFGLSPRKTLACMAFQIQLDPESHRGMGNDISIDVVRNH